jgi:sugar/nucleoside kinase (ribokinase family)
MRHGTEKGTTLCPGARDADMAARASYLTPAVRVRTVPHPDDGMPVRVTEVVMRRDTSRAAIEARAAPVVRRTAAGDAARAARVAAARAALAEAARIAAERAAILARMPRDRSASAKAQPKAYGNGRDRRALADRAARGP